MCIYLLLLKLICPPAKNNNNNNNTELNNSRKVQPHGSLIRLFHHITVPLLPGSCQGTPGIELPTAHERYRAVLPTCHGQNPDSLGSRLFLPNFFYRDVPDPEKCSQHFQVLELKFHQISRYQEFRITKQYKT